jgi:hypothetical protein
MGISSYRCWLFIVPVLERGFFLIADMPLGDSVLSKGNIASPSKKIKRGNPAICVLLPAHSISRHMCTQASIAFSLINLPAVSLYVSPKYVSLVADFRGSLTEKVLPPDEKHSDSSLIKGHDEILPGHISVSSGMYLQRVLSKSKENPNLSENAFALSRSEPDPPALKS